MFSQVLFRYLSYNFSGKFLIQFLPPLLDCVSTTQLVLPLIFCLIARLVLHLFPILITHYHQAIKLGIVFKACRVYHHHLYILSP